MIIWMSHVSIKILTCYKNSLYDIGIKGAASTGREWQFFMVVRFSYGWWLSVITAIPGAI